jgi:hypothetical protein
MAAPAANGIPNSSEAACAPNSDTSAIQPPAVSAWTSAGRTTERPNGIRARASWLTPARGPMVTINENTSAPAIAPASRTARPQPKPRPSPAAMVAIKSPDTSTFGVNHKVSCDHAEPNRAPAETGWMPATSGRRSRTEVGAAPS